MRVAWLMAMPMLAVAACAPLSVEQAETACVSEIRTAYSTSGGTVRAGMTNAGPLAMLRIDIGDRSANGDPARDYDACVRRRSGHPPRVALYDRPDWRG